MSSTNRTKALDDLRKLVEIRAKIAGHLRTEAKARRLAGDQKGASALSSQATRLNQQNFRILNTQRKLHAEASLGPALARMRAITKDAQEVEADIRGGADLLAAATTLVQIITRLSALFI